MADNWSLKGLQKYEKIFNENMFISKLILFIVFLTNLYNSFCEISDKRLCVDDKCSGKILIKLSYSWFIFFTIFSVAISLAKTLLRYSSPEPEGLSFAPNQEVKIFSKEAGSVTSLWGAEINGKRGYIPKHLVREYKILKKPTKLVATRLFEEPQVPNTSFNDVKPDKPIEPYEIIDGTKFYINPTEEEEIDSQGKISVLFLGNICLLLVTFKYKICNWLFYIQKNNKFLFLILIIFICFIITICVKLNSKYNIFIFSQY